MKKFLLIASCAAAIPAFALPTYEPFNEATFVNAIAASGSNAVDLATGGFSAPTGESWTGLLFNGTAGTGTAGIDTLVTNNPSSTFTATALASLLPSTFPGFPAAGQAITYTAINNGQPLGSGSPGTNQVGNSAVLNFSQDFVRPASGTKTLFISYLWNDDQQGATGNGNNGRYLAFLQSSNLVEGRGTSGYYQTFASFFNTFGTVNYAAHGVRYPNPMDIGACDAYSAANPSPISGLKMGFNQPVFVVGEVILVSTNSYLAGVKDTNILWLNPPPATFGGTSTATVSNVTYTLTNRMQDVGGLALINRVGAGASGGVGTNYFGNLMMGSTWSYVTGGPEFTIQPTGTNFVLTLGQTITLTAAATAAGQTVSYQWQKVTGTTTNNLTDGTGTAGGSAVVSGSGAAVLTLSGMSAGDVGNYQVVATASSTGYTLTSGVNQLQYVNSDPYFNIVPSPAGANYGGNASFTAGALTTTGSMSYQWYKGSAPVANGTQTDGCVITGASGSVSSNSVISTLTLTGVTYQERGNYSLWVTNGSGAALQSSAAALTVNDPYASTQPAASATGNYGASNSFTFTATGSAPLTYQWFTAAGAVANAGDITGANTGTISFTNMQLADANTYYCVATGPGGTVQSANLVLQVLPVVTQPPSGVLIAQGTSTNITVGTAPNVSYQWYSTNAGGAAVAMSNSGDFSGVLTSNLVLTNSVTNDSGEYYVVVSWTNNSQTLYQTSTIVSLYVVSGINLGPFSPTNWPTTVQNSSQITYGILDANAASDTPSMVTPPANWVNDVTLVAYNSAAQTWTPTTYAGLTGDTMTATYFNIVESTASEWQRFASYPIIDVLLQVWGNGAFYNSTNGSVSFEWCFGQLGQGPYYSKHYTFPLGANNSQWNWVLLEITNPVDSLVDSSPSVIPGDHVVGDVGNPPFNSSGGTYGGVNGGTLRMDGFNIGGGFTVRAIALGPQGAFGLPAEINRFTQPSNCPPEPATNLVYIDFNHGITNNLTVNNNAAVDETYQTVTGGPPSDQRNAIQATSAFMEFPILNNALGQPCNGTYTMQLCMEIYDDPALVGEQFGPYAYSTDPYGDIAFVPGYPNNYNQSFYTMQGSGQWVKVDWFVGPANLSGLNTSPLTGGPIVYWGLAGNPPLVDRIELGVIATGTNALAGQIPDTGYNLDPLICATNNNTNGYYAEWDPNHGVINNLAPPSTYTIGTAGPVNDQRTAEVPNSAGGSSGAWYEQFDLQNSVFGPVLQDNSDVVMTVTYYDDPALAGVELFVNEINSLQNGAPVLTPATGTNFFVILQGTGKWVDAQFEVSGMNFSPNTLTAAPTFLCRFASYGAVYISRVRANVIRSCGTYVGIDYLQGTMGFTTTNNVGTVSWRGQAALVGGPTVKGPFTPVVSLTNNATNSYPVPTNMSPGFYKLQFPSYPTNLSPYTPVP